MFCKIGLLKDFAKCTGKHLCRSLFLNKVVGFRSAILLKKRFWNKCFPVSFVKLNNTTEWQLLNTQNFQISYFAEFRWLFLDMFYVFVFPFYLIVAVDSLFLSNLVLLFIVSSHKLLFFFFFSNSFVETEDKEWNNIRLAIENLMRRKHLRNICVN